MKVIEYSLKPNLGKRKNRNRRIFAQAVGVRKKSYAYFLKRGLKYKFKILSIAVAVIGSFWFVYSIGEKLAVEVIKDASLYVTGIVLVMSFLWQLSHTIYEKDLELAQEIMEKLLTWLPSTEALEMTRRWIIAAETGNEIEFSLVLCKMYAERVLLPQMIPEIKERLKQEILSELLKKDQKIVVTATQKGSSTGEVQKEEVKAIRIIARCKEHGPLKPSETFRDNGRLYCIYCGGEVE